MDAEVTWYYFRSIKFLQNYSLFILVIFKKFKVDNSNIIIVGWGDGANPPYYSNASANIRVVARELNLIIKNIKNIFYPNDPSQFRIHCMDLFNYWLYLYILYILLFIVYLIKVLVIV